MRMDLIKFIDPVKIRVDVPDDQLPKLIDDLQHREDVIRKQFKVFFPFERAHEYQLKFPPSKYEFGVIAITSKSKDLIVFPYNNQFNSFIMAAYIELNRLNELSLKPILYKPFDLDPSDKEHCIIYAFELNGLELPIRFQ